MEHQRPQEPLTELSTETLLGGAAAVLEHDDITSNLPLFFHRRAYFHDLAGKNLVSAAILLTIHNIAYMQRLTKRIREAITEQRFPEFVRDFVRMHYPEGDEPEWVTMSLKYAGIEM